MARSKLNTLEDIGEASQLVNDFKVSKKSYFDLKHKQLELISADKESVDNDYWEDENFEAEVKIFEERKKLYDEAQELYKALKTKLEHGTL
ncbi:hypothetical protein MJD09_25075, partial [bacterium]|nr:hypothetical protein [bacterium]